MIPIILHLDMNSYFASVEQQDNPAWRGQPVGVCEHLGGILIAASIEAKKWGIKTGTPVWEAKKLYPKIILSHTHPDRYRYYHQRLVAVVSDYTDRVERYSIDEVFLDITKMCNIKFPISNFELPKNALTKNLKFPNQDLQEFYLKVENDYIFADPFEEAVKIAKEIKRRMKLEVADYMTCSVGIGENKLLAKIASDLKKPDGIVVINSDQDALSNANCRALSDAAVLFKSDLYRKLQLTDIPGIGKRQEKNLNELGIKTLLDLKNYPQSKLVARFGPVGGHHLYSMGQLEGSWKARVSQEDEIKSMGHMYTLPKEFREKKFFVPVLYKLCEMVGKRMRDKNLMGDSLHFFLAGADHKGWGKSARLGYGIYDGRDIFAECMKMFESFHIRSGEFKLIGVTIFGLGQHVKQLSLFGNEEEHVRVLAALDKINQKYGDFSICRVPILSAGKVFRDSIGFGRLKEMPNMYGRGG